MYQEYDRHLDVHLAYYSSCLDSRSYIANLKVVPVLVLCILQVVEQVFGEI